MLSGKQLPLSMLFMRSSGQAALSMVSVHRLFEHHPSPVVSCYTYLYLYINQSIAKLLVLNSLDCYQSL